MKSLFRTIGEGDLSGYKYLLRIAILVFPSFIILDVLIYPTKIIPMVIIRISTTIFMAATYLLINKLNKSVLNFIILASFYVVASSISLMCLISGEGFDSPYYVGVLQIFIGSALIVGILPNHYAALVALVVVQHFTILWIAAPFSYRGVWINIFGLGIFSIVCVSIHRFIYKLAQENKTLRGIVPICSKCKKIRDDEGYWQEVASYISRYTEAEFSHGYCPGCAKEAYAELDAILPEKKSTGRHGKNTT